MIVLEELGKAVSVGFLHCSSDADGGQQVGSLTYSRDQDSLTIHSLLPSGQLIPISHLPFTRLSTSIPVDLLPAKGIFSGFIQKFSRTRTGWYDTVRVRVYESGGRPCLVLGASMEGSLYFWRWNPLAGGECEFLCKGPEELDDFSEVSFLERGEEEEDEEMGSMLVLVSPLGSIYTKAIKYDDDSWTCLDTGSSPVTSSLILPYDHDSTTVCISHGRQTTVSMINMNGIVELGRIDGLFGEILIAEWNKGLDVLYLVGTDRDGTEIVSLSLIDDTKLVESARARIPERLSKTATYKDEFLEADLLVSGISAAGKLYHHSLSKSTITQITDPISISLDHNTVSDVRMEPSMQVEILSGKTLLTTLDHLMTAQSWQETVPPKASPALPEFAEWFDLMGPFPYTTGVCGEKGRRRGEMGGELLFDWMVGMDVSSMYPPSCWSDLGSLAASITSTTSDLVPFLYLMLDSKQSSHRITSFCKRFNIPSNSHSLAKTLLALDTADFRLALHLLPSLLPTLHNPALARKLVSAIPGEWMECALQVVGRGLLGMGPLEEIKIVCRSRMAKALLVARKEGLVRELFLEALSDDSMTSALLKSPLTPSEESILTHLLTTTTNTIDVSVLASTHVLLHLARGRNAPALSTFDGWNHRVPADSIRWNRVREAIQCIRPAIKKSGGVKSIECSNDMDVETDAEMGEKTLAVEKIEMAKTGERMDIPVVLQSPKKPSSLLRTPPPAGPTTPNPYSSPHHSSPSAAATAAPSSSSPSLSGSPGRSPPLRALLPRHVPANRPSRLANLVSSSYKGDKQEVLLEENVFSHSLMDYLEDYSDSSSDNSDDGDDGDVLMVDDEIGNLIASEESSKEFSRNSKEASGTSEESSGNSDSEGSHSSDSSSPKNNSISNTSVESPASLARRKRGEGLRALPPIHYPVSLPSPRRRHHHPSRPSTLTIPEPVVLVTPVEAIGATSNVPPKTPRTPRAQIAKGPSTETRSQFKRRIKESLGLPSPIVKRSKATKQEQPISSIRSSPRRTKTPATDQSPAKRGPGRPRKTVDAPSDAEPVTPPIRMTPPAVTHRRRR